MTEEQYNKSIFLKSQIHELDKLIELMEGRRSGRTYKDGEEIALNYRSIHSIMVCAIDNEKLCINNTSIEAIPEILFPRILNIVKEYKDELEKEFSEL